jgi:dynein heavy chain
MKFGPKGWNRSYPFNTGDLLNSAEVLKNYVENSADKIPWADLRYMFGEILYGGHITDDLDRLLCNTYLEFYMREELLDEMELFPYAESHAEETFRSPPPLAYEMYMEYIDRGLPAESPIAYGLHTNTEIAVKTTEATNLFSAILNLQPRSGGGSGGSSPLAVVKQMIPLLLDDVKGVHFNVDSLKSNIDRDSMGPYQNVFLQECERMNMLTSEIRRSLEELTLGIAGELQMSDRMDDLLTALFLRKVPDAWAKLAYPSLRSLDGWMQNLLKRVEQIEQWIEDPLNIPKVVDISLFFNPQSFLTAIMQKYSQINEAELDKLTISTNVTRKNKEQTETAARAGGAFVNGFYLEGASWNWNQMMLQESQPREMFCEMPVVGCNAIMVDRMEKTGVYYCPVFKTQQRGPTFVFTANLRSKAPASKWVLGGVIMVLETD